MYARVCVCVCIMITHHKFCGSLLRVFFSYVAYYVLWLYIHLFTIQLTYMNYLLWTRIVVDHGDKVRTRTDDLSTLTKCSSSQENRYEQIYTFHMYMCMHMYVYIQIYLCILIYVWYVYICMSMHLIKHTYAYICMYVL